LPSIALLERKSLARIADFLAVAVAVSLPWSTSASGILLSLWVTALIPTFSWRDVRHQLVTLVGGLPVLLLLLGALGAIWANVTWQARWDSFDSFVRLAAIPLLMAQCSRSDIGRRILIGFLIACIAVLIASFAMLIWPTLFQRPDGGPGIPVKSYIVQSLEFAMCAAVLCHLAFVRARDHRWKSAVAFVVLALAFLVNILFVTTGRTTLIVIPVLIVVYGFHRASWRGVLGAVAAAVVIAVIVWAISPFVRDRITTIYTEVRRYEQQDQLTSAGMRLDWWKTSIGIIADAPIIGHGTGSIPTEFDRATQHPTTAHGVPSRNPHNQTLAVGIQLGLLGIAVLWAMWLSQLMFFNDSGVVGWVGLVVVTANIAGSLFNSFVFDFTEGWIYVFGVGIAAGMARSNRA
jgi:O-antigen ligase